MRKKGLLALLTNPLRDCGNTSVERGADNRGFTLIETTIAMLILMVSGLGMASMFTYSIRYNSGGNDRAVAISIAQQQIEQCRGVQFGDAILAVSAATLLTPDTISNGRTYRVTKTVTGSNNDVNGNPTLKTVTIMVEPASAGWAGYPVTLRTIRTANSNGTH